MRKLFPARVCCHLLSFCLPIQIIVGVNGSGKSTILKLMSRIYDPTEGTIFIDDTDIKTLKLADLRRAMSILFQDYTHFPLSVGFQFLLIFGTLPLYPLQIKENIALGNPNLAPDDDKIREAARLGGAEEFVDKLPEGFDTYLDRPVRDYYSALPEGTTMLFGRKVDYSRVRGAGAMRAADTSSLSGGQMQRLAVYVQLLPLYAARIDANIVTVPFCHS